MTNGNIVLLGVGDVGPSHEPVNDFCTLVRPVFATADLRFAQCERMCTDKGSLMPHGSPTGRTPSPMFAAGGGGGAGGIVRAGARRTRDAQAAGAISRKRGNLPSSRKMESRLPFSPTVRFCIRAGKQPPTRPV